MLSDALTAETITREIHKALFAEANEWKRHQLDPKFSMIVSSTRHPHVDVSTMLGQQYSLSLHDLPTVRALKIALGKLMDDRDPRTIRLFFQGGEIKVKKTSTPASTPILAPDSVQTPSLPEESDYTLEELGVTNGSHLEAITSLSRYAGLTEIKEIGVDKDGNSLEQLGTTGGFKGLGIALLDLYGARYPLHEEKIHDNTLTALRNMGFEVTVWSSNNIPEADEFRRVLDTCTQLWVLSTNEVIITSEHLDVIKAYHDGGKSLFLWGDNDPFNKGVNPVIDKVLPGVRLEGDYHACKHVHVRPPPESMPAGERKSAQTDSQTDIRTGFDGSHIIFTGIKKLYEGNTIARFAGTENTTRLQFIMYSSEPSPALGVCESTLQGAGRVAIDVGFTKLFCSWDEAGTAAFVKNIAAWLCNLESDW